MEIYTLEKWIWTEADFDTMGWHDATIYGLKLNGELSLDIDYIFKWNEPEVKGFQFTFFIAPCTLTFKDIDELSFELIQTAYNNFQIEDVEREQEDGKTRYAIITEQGDISFVASGFTQTVRMMPSFQLQQSIDYQERGGVSFDNTIDKKLDADTMERVNQRRERELEHYTWAKERHAVKKEIEALRAKRDNNEIGLKEFLEKKNYLKDKLAYYNIILRGTHYEAD
jgi:hypothetical protein